MEKPELLSIRGLTQAAPFTVEFSIDQFLRSLEAMV